MKFKYIELTNGKVAEGLYQIISLDESIKKNFSFKELTTGEIAKAVCFIDLDKNIISV